MSLFLLTCFCVASLVQSAYLRHTIITSYMRVTGRPESPPKLFTETAFDAIQSHTCASQGVLRAPPTVHRDGI